MEKVDELQLNNLTTQRGLLHLPVHNNRFAVPAMLDTGATWLFVIYKLAAKLPATIQSTKPLTLTLATGKALVATSAIQLDMLIDDFIYM